MAENFDGVLTGGLSGFEAGRALKNREQLKEPPGRIISRPAIRSKRANS